ncbi:hypothetical protein HZ993_12070 [Rhodoferax sp. AJA081-3]|uniref:hypothetical protein n=1 Tax=Rhodoferax sp. AJA081-3 TaxID=2752316 RepID=UPI001AE045DC|nr:hypothetical protein [Rhodoferax sp. AJA081-3]QTN30425.1 hypothetical protein HZ993_12070 [Rhodoferax sp. AJA081-3]
MSEPTGTASSGLALNSALVGDFPSPPARLLLLGSHPKADVCALKAQAYEIVEARFRIPAWAQAPSPTRQGVYRVDVALQPATPAGFDAAWVQGVSPQIHPLALFDQLRTQVVQDGLLCWRGMSRRKRHA